MVKRKKERKSWGEEVKGDKEGRGKEEGRE